MAIETFGVPLAYVITAALLLWTAAALRGAWWLKALLISACVFFSLSLWHSLEGLQGWPVESDLPAKFEINWTLTEEPNKKTGRPGAVYVWATDLNPGDLRRPLFPLTLHRKGLRREARAYTLPYSRALHEQTEEIKASIMTGARYFGTMRKGGLAAGPKEGAPGGGRPGEAEGMALGEGGGDRGEASRSYHQDYVFQPLPPARFPEKTPPATP